VKLNNQGSKFTIQLVQFLASTGSANGHKPFPELVEGPALSPVEWEN